MSAFTVINPSTGAAIREIARADIGETDAAIARAVVAPVSYTHLTLPTTPYV